MSKLLDKIIGWFVVPPREREEIRALRSEIRSLREPRFDEVTFAHDITQAERDEFLRLHPEVKASDDDGQR